MAFEPFVYAEAGTRGTAELTADLLLLASDVLRRLADQLVVGLVTRQSRGVGRAVRSPQNFELALRHAAAVAVLTPAPQSILDRYCPERSYQKGTVLSSGALVTFILLESLRFRPCRR